MTSIARIMDLSGADGQPWFEESLRGGESLVGGFDVSLAVLGSTEFDQGDFYALVSNLATPDQINFPHFPDVKGSDARLARYLDGLTGKGASCVVIEDEVARRTDHDLSDLPIASGYIDDRVIHWCDLAPGFGEAAVDVISKSAFGYPLNAFVVTKSASELSLVNDQPVADGFVGAVTEHLLAIIVSAFDATSYSMWERREPA